jgi:threonine dehydratase
MALTARLLTTPARPIDACIIMPETASKAKKAAVLGYGARVVECPSDTRTRQLTCDAEMLKASDPVISPTHSSCLPASPQITQSGGKTLFVSPFDDSRVICGQGTAVLEAAAQIRGEWGDGIPPDVIITPVGGGGLLSGSAVAAKGLWQDVKVVAAEPEGGLHTLAQHVAAKKRILTTVCGRGKRRSSVVLLGRLRTRCEPAADHMRRPVDLDGLSHIALNHAIRG